MSDNLIGRYRDPMTGAVTEEALLRFLDAVLGMAEPTGPQVGVLCLAIDGLDRVAARHGAAVRDAALLGMADHMHERIRNQDLLGRIDGGFAICLADIYPAQAASAARRLLQAVKQEAVPTPVGAMALTCSIGLVMSRGGAEHGSALLGRARVLRDAARQAGGDVVVTSM